MNIVIIESPFAGDVDKNIAYARAALRDSLLRGEAPYASHLLYTQEDVLDDNDDEQRLMGMTAGWAFVRVADYIAVYDDLGVSKGMKQGIVSHIDRGFNPDNIKYRQIDGWNNN